MHAALHGAGVGAVVTDATGRIIAINETACEQLGVARLDTLGQPFQLLLCPELHLPKFREIFNVDGPTIRTKGERMVDGANQIFLINARTHVCLEGERCRIVALINPLSFGASYDQATATRNNQRTVNTSVLLLDGVSPGYPVIGVNATFELIFGYRVREAIGQGFAELIKPRGTDAGGDNIAETISLAIQQGQILRQVFWVQARDGRSFQVDWRQTALFDANGARRQIMVSMRPMTPLPSDASTKPVFLSDTEGVA